MDKPLDGDSLHVAGSAPVIGAGAVELEFKVDPEYLKRCPVPDAVRIRFTDPEKIFLTGILGESGRLMVLAGAPFYFTRRLAEQYIAWGIAVEAQNNGAMPLAPGQSAAKPNE